MIIGLLIILSLVLFLPFTIKIVEHNLEYFLFIMGSLAVIITGSLSTHLLLEILGNPLLYFITFAVLIGGLLFSVLVNKIKSGINIILGKITFPLFVFLVIVVLGLASSIITAIIASLVLVEIIHALPIKHIAKIRLAVVACFSIGLGAALTPIGEPLATISITKLNADFWYLLNQLGIYIIPGILTLGLFGAYYVKKDIQLLKCNNNKYLIADLSKELSVVETEEVEIKKLEKNSEIFTRAFKIFVFIIALELLGSGFKPLIDVYVVKLDSMVLYWINMVSAVLDNATMAAAEVSPSMNTLQVKSVLMGLLISGGILIPGNIPNIVVAAKLKIKSREWAVTGIPIGLFIMVVYFVILFLL